MTAEVGTADKATAAKLDAAVKPTVEKAPETQTAEKVETKAKPAAEKTAAVTAGATQTEAKPKGYKVTGAAVVLRGDDGSERYLYRGAPVDGGAFSKDSIKHALSVGLIEKAK